LLVGTFFYLSVPDIPRSVLEAKYATPPSQFLTLADGARVHYRDQGPKNAPVLVLVHGSNASLFTWEPWIARLGDTYRIVTMDMPSHGLTGAVPSHDYSQKGMAAFFKQVADKIGLEAFAIGGHSMGGGVECCALRARWHTWLGRLRWERLPQMASTASLVPWNPRPSKSNL
jgi:pimeloyl-ACP methyl ester carboxylesterase